MSLHNSLVYQSHNFSVCLSLK